MHWVRTNISSIYYFTEIPIILKQHIQSDWITNELRKPWGDVLGTLGRTDRRTDGLRHGIIRPFFKRAYKKIHWSPNGPSMVGPWVTRWINGSHLATGRPYFNSTGQFFQRANELHPLQAYTICAIDFLCQVRPSLQGGPHHFDSNCIIHQSGCDPSKKQVHRARWLVRLRFDIWHWTTETFWGRHIDRLR